MAGAQTADPHGQFIQPIEDISFNRGH
jgi:hypothetical protein